MAMKCANCDKGVMYGHNVSHSKRRTRRIFKPNLHQARIVVNGRTMAAKFCTKCLRMVKKVAAAKNAVTPVVPQVPQVAAVA